MKYTYLILLMLCGCGNPYPEENRFVVFEKGGRGQVDSILFIKDTMIIYRSWWISNDSTLMRLMPGHSTIKLPQYIWAGKDSFKLKFDSLWVLQYKGEDSFDINIESHNGDILTGKSVKNVYNNKP